jgi:hypothetical protein
MGVALAAASSFAGRSDIIGWQSTGLGAAQITVVLLVASLLGWTVISVGLLVPITFGLVRRQRTRKTLVRVGRARSWVARPGQGQYAGAQTQPGHFDGYDEDRLVERVPGAGADAPDAGDMGFGRPGGSGLGGSGLGGSGLGGSGLGGSGLGGSDLGSPGPGASGVGTMDRGDPGFREPSLRLPADDVPGYEMPGLDGFGGSGSGGSSGGILG